MKKQLLLLTLIFGGATGFAQTISLSPEVYSPGGELYVGDDFEISYTIGELAAVSTISSANFALTQGFHQPDKFTIILIDPLENLLGAEIYPNPSSDLAQIKISSDNYYKLNLSLFDVTGKEILNQSLQHSPGEQIINLPVQDLSAGTYLVRLTTQDGEVAKTLRLNKIHQ
jgi:hypothetical protein